jgi:hypothetical protein
MLRDAVEPSWRLAVKETIVEGLEETAKKPEAQFLF